MADRKILRFVVVGAGMSGILAVYRLKEMGHEVVALEKAAKIGGTWRDNRYPGLSCDTPAHTYSLSFEHNPEWTHNYVNGPEIQAYFEKLVDRHDLMPHIRLGQEVIAIEFRNGLWHVDTAQGLHLEADVVIAASGVLHHPKMPDIEGLASFAGVAMHSACWDKDLVLNDKRIGVIGTGSTGVQMIAALAGQVPHLVHFQRTPQWIRPHDHFAYSEEQREAFRRDPALIDGIRNDPRFLADLQAFTSAIIDANSAGVKALEDICRDNLEKTVKNPVLREKLRPTYRAACKRIVSSPDYYEKVQLPGVAVEVGRIARVEPNGVRMEDGSFHELDVLALATGFHTDRYIRPATVIGRNGTTLDETWATRPRAYYAITIPDFPNFFMLNGPTAPVGNFSLTDIAEIQWNYIRQLIEKLERGDCKEISPSHEALERYMAAHREAAKHTVFASGCTSWYLDAEGIPLLWPWSYNEFRAAMAKPAFEDFEMADAAERTRQNA